ncbi:enoyl-CoA hydratase-related protein [Limnochorda pilosa]|uniref:Enoyl-CoA hydratase/carnithine racemase n=1 Tax=Limnochorda pilosa TaxID=1555112 RepID=A0A0K2SFK7_LIMPI|nr:enoyl-CoA hydratase-related protein [Limnochorda pilosa]BAS25881.1 enoyl-CoA hydratase/carnithine racemase [Limnochorda pilosa]
MAGETVLLRVDAEVATITLNRPEVLNALDLTVAEALAEVLESCEGDLGVRAVILTGADRGFCAGGDMRAAWQHVQAGGDPRAFFRELTVPLHRAITSIRRMEKPVVAAVNGAAGGAGMSLAAACDLRVAAEGAKFRQAYTSIGLVPDGGWTATVPHLVGAARAAELLLLDPVLDARQALAWGLVHEVVPDADLPARVRDLAARLAQGPTSAYGGAKALVNAALLPTLKDQMERERWRIIEQGAGSDFAAGLSAFIEKREPRFRVGRR